MGKQKRTRKLTGLEKVQIACWAECDPRTVTAVLRGRGSESSRIRVLRAAAELKIDLGGLSQ